MKRIILKDKKFKPFISTPDIETTISRMAAMLNERFKHTQDPVVFLVVLNGASIYGSSLFMKLKFPVVFDTIKVSSYDGMNHGDIKFEKFPSTDFKGKQVVIVEDIIDTGVTIDAIKEYLLKNGATDVTVSAMLIKPDIYREHHPEWNQWEHITGENKDNIYVGLSISNGFVVGYGLDYDGLGRNLNKIYILDE